jgi:hypothetical protein
MTHTEQMELESILAERRKASIVFLVAALVAVAAMLALAVAVASAG